MTKQKTPRVNPESYQFVTTDGLEDPTICITESTNPFAGVVVSYSNIGVKEENSSAALSFEYNIQHSAGLERSAFNDDFVQHIGDILADQIDLQIREEKVKYVKHTL